jgi:Suppressor of fused protein (SUFU)
MALSKPSVIVSHIERHIGRIEEMRQLSGAEFDLRAGIIPQMPEPDLNTYVTVGVSNHILRWGEGKVIRQELVVVANSSHSKYEMISFLLSLGEFITTAHRALLQGAVVGPSAPVIPNAKTNAVHATTPTIFPDEFAILKDGEVPVLFVLIIPILAGEAVFIQQEGWEKFEEVLESPQQDIFDLSRDML